MCSTSLADTLWTQGCKSYELACCEYAGLMVLPRLLGRAIRRRSISVLLGQHTCRSWRQRAKGMPTSGSPRLTMYPSRAGVAP